MPSVTFGLVVGVLCEARIPGKGETEKYGSSITASLGKVS
jgi:hypothetical protein